MVHSQSAPIPIFDGHNDVLGDVLGTGSRKARSFLERSDQGHLDLPRALEAGFGGGFFAVYVPPDPAAAVPAIGPQEPDAEVAQPAPELEQTFALRVTVAMTAALFRTEAESGGRLRVVHRTADLQSCLIAGVLAAILHFEGAEVIDRQFNALHVFHRAGLRSLGLVWSRPNAYAEGVPFRFPSTPDTGPGLTGAGKALVRECNALGVMLDLSHLNERGFWDVASVTQAPLVATHSNAHALTPSPRNLLDTQLDAIRDSGGIVGVNFSVAFSRPDGKRDADTPITALVDHFDYLIKRMGIDHVAFGSDFDGTTIPAEMGDVRGLPKLVAALRDRGYGDSELRKLGYENWVRVLSATWKG